MTALRVLIVNAGCAEGNVAARVFAERLGRVSLMGVLSQTNLPGYVRVVDEDCSDEAGWERFVASLLPGDRFDVIVHCPSTGDACDVVSEIHSAWLTAKFAIRVGSKGELALLTLHRRDGGPEAVQRRAASHGIRFATWAGQLDASKEGVRIRSNRLEIPRDWDEQSLAEAILALTDDRASFVAGADVRLESSLIRGESRSSSLEGKTILVTGATSGIGRATAVEIARRGGWVAIGGRKPALAAETLDLVRDAGGDGIVVTLDVTDAVAWEAALGATLAARGRLDGLVNNAGEAENRPISDLSEDVVKFLVGLNYGGCRLGMDTLLDALASARGAVVNVASVAGMRAGFGGSAYGASKAAMIALSQAFSSEVAARRGVRVNCIQPGLIWSDGVIEALGEEGARQFRESVEKKTPLGRVGAPAEVARFIAFLLSDAAAGIFGQAIPVSGGLELTHP